MSRAIIMAVNVDTVLPLTLSPVAEESTDFQQILDAESRMSSNSSHDFGVGTFELAIVGKRGISLLVEEAWLGSSPRRTQPPL